MITKTTLQLNDDYLIIARLINNNYNVIEFDKNVPAHALVPYFNMVDVMFTKLCTSTYIKDKVV